MPFNHWRYWLILFSLRNLFLGFTFLHPLTLAKMNFRVSMFSLWNIASIASLFEWFVLHWFHVGRMHDSYYVLIISGIWNDTLANFKRTLNLSRCKKPCKTRAFTHSVSPFAIYNILLFHLSMRNVFDNWLQGIILVQNSFFGCNTMNHNYLTVT